MSDSFDSPRRALRNQHVKNVEMNSTPIKIPASPFLMTLGYGTGVNVYRLDRSPKCGQTRSPWAVKRITERTREKVESADLFKERILREAEILRKLNHQNIIGFRGVVKSIDGIDTLVLEVCGISLGSILEERNDSELGPLPAKQSLKFILDISHALDYLHSEALLLHGDLKSFNVLVKGEFEICKLCDFGVSLPLDENGEINFTKNPELRYVGTSIWSAPEVIDEFDIIDSKADIFSFGLVVYETLALVPPHTLELSEQPSDDESPKQDEPDISLHDTTNNELTQQWIEKIESAYGTRPPLPVAFQLSDDYNQIVEIFYCCTNNLSEDRPSAKTIWQIFEPNDSKEKSKENEEPLSQTD